MNTLFLFFLFIFGTLFGSFASVLIYRIRSGEGGIMTGRSHCKTCKRNLTALELIPLISWCIQGGKCKGCKQKISAVYPFLELTMGFLFAQVGFFLVDFSLIFSGDILEIFRLGFFLSIIFLTVIYVFYDILYLEIPESVLLVANIFAFGGLVGHGLGYKIIPYLPVGNLSLLDLSISLGVLGGLYYIFLAGLKEIYDVLIMIGIIMIFGSYLYFTPADFRESALLSGTLAALGIYLSFFLQIILSGGRWMGAGDLRIAILMGLLVGISFAFPAWMITYLTGSIIGIFVIYILKKRHTSDSTLQHQIPFGPFLAIGYLSILFFSPYITNFIEWYF